MAAATLAGLLAAGWGLLLLGRGQSKVLAWWLVMGFGLVGVALVVLAGVLLLLQCSRRRAVSPPLLILLVLSFVAAWPAGWWVGVGDIAFPAKASELTPAAWVRLPFDQPVRVGWGGDTAETNEPHVGVPFERWAFDFLADPAGVGSKDLNDYGIYGAKVLAPADGTVTDVRDDAEDLVPGTEPDEGSLHDMLGNYVTVRLKDTGTYLVLAHLRQGSLTVRVGQPIREGDPLGQVGNSGSSSEPHLHIHHQRQDPAHTLLLAEGLPLYFRDTTGPPMPRGGVQRTNDGREVPVGAVIAPAPPSLADSAG